MTNTVVSRCWVKSPHQGHRVKGYPYWDCPGVEGVVEPEDE
jgi:hypothetical protein